MGYLSFQGAGASSVNVAGAAPLRRLDEGPSPPPSAPWCVNTWGPDLHGEERRKFPVELAGGAFAEALGIPLQLYAPYFCPESKYFSRVDPSSNWTSVVSDTSIDGCSFYGGQRHFNPLFLGRFSPVFRRFYAVFPRFLASWRQDGENALKIVVFG